MQSSGETDAGVFTSEEEPAIVFRFRGDASVFHVLAGLEVGHAAFVPRALCPIGDDLAFGYDGWNFFIE
ncbi:hypothetical protein D3C72_2331460 [compost metagenome]